MPDIEDSLRRYADALERAATARVDAPPRRRRGALIACAAAIAIVAIASTAILITRDGHDSRVTTVGESSTNTTAPRDPKVWVTAKVELDKTTFLPGEDVTGEITFTNHLPTDVLITDPNGCLNKWGVGIAPQHDRINVFQTMECRSGPTLPEPAGSYLAFRPGVTRVPLWVSGTFQECTGSDAITNEIPHCLANTHPPNLPVGRARIQLVISDAGGRVHAPGPIPVRIERRGHRRPFCTRAQLEIQQSDIALANGKGRATFAATNTSPRTCVIDGVPVVGLLGGAIVPDRYVAITTVVDDAALALRTHARPVVLRPRARTSFAITYSTNNPGEPTPGCRRKIPVLSVTLPDQGGNVDVPSTMEPCPGTGVGASEGLVAVTVSPFVAGSGGVHR